MTFSVRTCYCKRKDNNILRKKDNDVKIHNGNGRVATTASKKSVITNEAYGSNGGSSKRTSGEKMPNTNWLVEEEPINTILSPETSTALENAEKIVNSAKIQLMEVCGMSSIDSARRYRNTAYSDLPLDNESEELLYIRELVASKFHEATSSRSETNGRASVNSEEPARPTVHRTDLSAPKFRTSRRRHADWSSRGYGSDTRSPCERASSADGAWPPKDSPENVTATMRGDDRRASSAASIEREPVRAQRYTCRIQTGPSVHIVDRELTQQNLEDVHISPESFRNRANTATYTVRHGENILEGAASEPEASKAPKTLRVRLDAPRQRQRQRQRERSIVAEIATKVATDASSESERKIKDAGRNDGLIESTELPAKEHIYAEERIDRAFDDTKVSERAENSHDEKSRNEPRREEQAEITSGDDTNGRYAEDRGRMFDKKSGVAKRSDDRFREENRSDRSKSAPLVSDASGKMRCENIASRLRQKPRTITDDEHLSSTFDSHDEQRRQDVIRDETSRRSSASSCSDDFQTEDDLDEINLYRPHFEDLNSVLSSNSKKIERAVRAVETFDELLSRFEFAKDQRHEGEFEGFHDDGGKKFNGFVLNEPTLQTELKREDNLVRASPEKSDVVEDFPRRGKADANPQTIFVDGKKSSLTKDDGCSSSHLKNLVHPDTPASDASNGGTSRKGDKTEEAKFEAHSSVSSLDKWDFTTYSNMAPVLSSTRTETQDTQRDVKLTTVNRFSERDRPHEKDYRPDSIFTRITRSLKDDAADRFVAYFLQDERRSIEKKVTCALKESAIEPATVRKLLDCVREAGERIRDARRMETLDILKNILMNVEQETDRGVNNEGASNVLEKTASQEVPGPLIGANAPPNVIADLISREEDAPKAKTDADEIERVAENFRDLQSGEKHPSGSLELQETKGSVRSACDFAPNSKGKTKGNSCSEGESLKQISDIRSDDGKNSGEGLPANLSAKTASEKSSVAPSRDEERHTSNEKRENEPAHNKDPVSDERCENKSIIAATDKDENKTSALGCNVNGQQTTTDLDQRSDISREAFCAVKETRVEENSTLVDKKSAFPEGSETKNERVHSEASSAGSKFADKIAAKKDADRACSAAQENIESLRVSEQMINAREFEEKISPADCRSVDSLRDCASLSSLKNSRLSLRDVASTNKQISPSFTGQNNSKDIRGDEICEDSTTIAAVENHGSEEGGLLNGAKSDNEKQQIDRANTLRKYKINISSSNSSISSALLDQDRFSNGVLSANSRKVETSSEASHSEGELYMPSSCSYSLGEVRMLKKRNFIVDSATDRDSSTTVLITRSMLTSLNDSTASLLEDSGHI